MYGNGYQIRIKVRYKAALPHFLGGVLFFLGLCVVMQVNAATDATTTVYQFENAAQEAQYHALITEFRCPKCQNQNLASSDSVIAQNLKQKTYELVKTGQTDTQIRNYMVARYGDFISYKPPVNAATGLLWFFPPVLLFGVFLWWLFRQSKRKEQARVEMLSVAEQQQLAVLLAAQNRAQNETKAKQDTKTGAVDD